MRQITTCGSCGVEWIHKTDIDIKDYWYEYIPDYFWFPNADSIMFCEQCHADGKSEEFAMEVFEKHLKENDSGHQPA